MDQPKTSYNEVGGDETCRAVEETQIECGHVDKMSENRSWVPVQDDVCV